MQWGFYGRQSELQTLQSILDRRRWFFAQISGRRRIGKTTLIQRAMQGRERLLYVQIPDSGPAGVLSAVRDAFETFAIGTIVTPPTTLAALANMVGVLAHKGFVIVLDEFQYFNRKHLYEFTSQLQRVVDRLAIDNTPVTGGLFVLGSLHTEMTALLEDRRAPLYNRTTDTIELGHLDVAAILEILRAHADTDPSRLLLLWNLFEGVPKFYRDCYEQGTLNVGRQELLRKMFFQSSAPLRTEADNWFLHELRGRYDVVLKFVARHPGCSNGEIESHVRSVSTDTAEQAAGYLKILIERFRMIERKLPIFAKPTARKGRYYIRDNFLRSWLAALAPVMTAINFRPIDDLVVQADERLKEVEGHGLELLVAELYAERSRKGLPGFALSRRIEGYWDSADTEIDLVAFDEPSRNVRFAFCKRAPGSLLPSLSGNDAHVSRFLNYYRKYSTYHLEKVAIAPTIESGMRAQVASRGWIPEDLHDLTRNL